MLQRLALLAALSLAAANGADALNSTSESSRFHINSICGKDTTVPAKCYLPNSALGSTLPLAYERAQAVVRPRKGSIPWCTGWLLGSEGHFMTNYHCIKTQEEADVFGVEFAAESTSCSDECITYDCGRGFIATKSTTFVAGNAKLDYALLKLPPTVDARRYGYLQLRESGPVLNERIYMIGHPADKAKRIAATLDDGTPAVVSEINLNGTSCTTGETGASIVRYKADSEGGSSGSPVIAARDNAVVALHNCGGCNAADQGSNLGVDIRDIIRDFKAKGIVIRDLFVDGTTTTPRAGMCDSLGAAACQQLFLCSWNSVTSQCQRWWK